MSDFCIRFEPLNYLMQTGLLEMGERSWAQIGNDRDVFEYDPNWYRYAMAENNNSLRFMAMRDGDGNLRGYASIFIMENLHDRKVLSAYIQDLYIEPEARKGYGAFKEFMDEIVKMLGLCGIKHLTIGERENDERGGVGIVYKRYGFHSDQRLWTISLKGN